MEDLVTRRQCTATTDRGRCKRAPIPGGSVCASHGGKAPQTIAAARQRLLEGVEPAIVRLLKFIETPPGLCETRGRSDDTSAIVSAIRTLLDRAGLGPSSTIKVGSTSAPQSWLRWLTNDQYDALLEMMAEATDRMNSGAPPVAGGGIRQYVEIPADKTVVLPENTRDVPALPSYVDEGSFVEIEIDDEGDV